MYPLKTLFVIITLVWLTACGFLPELDDVLPDQREAYRDARSLPPLEVPPDLTSSSINDTMAIPGEQMPNTLSAYERQQSAGDAALGVAMADEQTLIVQGDQYAVWPRLQDFWTERGFALELDDVELGVQETTWSEPRTIADGEVRDRYRVFAEPGVDAGTTALFVSHDQQRRAGPAGEWLDAGSDSALRQQAVAALSSYFGGGQQQAAAAPTDASTGTDAAATTTTQQGSRVARAEIINNDQGQVYMSLPEGFEQAWEKLESALTEAGLEVRSAEKEAGEYLVAYQPPEEEEDEGWFDSLMFWSSDEPTLYRVSVSAAAERTELVLRDEDGEWQSDDSARNLLYKIQQQYNR